MPTHSPNSQRAPSNPLRTICIYCGSSDRVDGIYKEAAQEMGALLAKRNIALVFGGGKTGIMGALSDAVLAAGGQVIGVIPEMFNTPELVHRRLSELHVVPDMHTRKAQMAARSDAFIALPGGFGTFEELFEILTWAQIGLHQRPIGLLNIGGYFDPLLQLIEHAQQTGFIYREHQDLLLHASQPAALLNALGNYQPPAGLARWVQRKEEVR